MKELKIEDKPLATKENKVQINNEIKPQITDENNYKNNILENQDEKNDDDNVNDQLNSNDQSTMPTDRSNVKGDSK